MALLLGIDIGTSSTKAVLFDPDSAQVLAVAGQEYPIHKPAPDRAEQDPDDWWNAAVTTVRRVVVQTGRSDVAGISLSGLMHGAVLLDRAGKPLRPAIIWADQRSAPQVRELIATIGAERYTAVCGTLPAAGFTAPTLLWLLQHEPESLDTAYKVVISKDYVRIRMTGEIVTDVTDAASSGIFDVARRTWAWEFIRAVGLPEAIFPNAVESLAVVGYLTASAADALGLSPGIPVLAGCGDQPAQAVGNGLIAPGRASVTTGSGGQVLTPIQIQDGKVPTDARLHVFNHAVPNMCYIMGATLSAGLSLRWFRNLLGLENAPDAYPLLSAEAGQVSPGADGLLFLPYLSGERTPHMDALARGAFVGLNYHHTRAHLARAIMEGVVFSLRQALEISLSLGGSVDMVVAAGGASQSDVWRQIHADVFGIPLRRNLLAEQGGVGLALMAGVSVGIYRDLNEAVSSVVHYGEPTDPDSARRAVYDELYQQYVGLYPHLREDFAKLSVFSHQ